MADRMQELLDIVIPSDKLDIDKSGDGLLGRGGYGSVYSGTYKGKKIAVKMLSDEGDIPKQQRHSLKREARRLREACDHPYILDLIGVVMETNNYSLVLEYMHFGTSVSFIKHFIVGVPLRIQFAEQIISAMAWLHSQKPPMKHLDLKADNVLINNFFTAKICDFGLSEWKTVTMAYSTQPIEKGPRCGTMTHIPPEVFNNINSKGEVEEDVYAFAVTLWEIFSSKIPFSGCSNQLIMNAVMSGQRPDLYALEPECPDLIRDMIRLSWDQKPQFRPTFENLERNIAPIYDAVRGDIPELIKYIRAQIVTNFQKDPEENREYFECTEHFEKAQNGVVARSKNGVVARSENGVVARSENGVVARSENGVVARSENGLATGAENGLPRRNRLVTGTEIGLANVTDNGGNHLMNGQASPDGDDRNRNVTVPPILKPLSNGSSEQNKPDVLENMFPGLSLTQSDPQTLRPEDLNTLSRQPVSEPSHTAIHPQVLGDRQAQKMPETIRNLGLAHVPISETRPKQIINESVGNTRQPDSFHLSGFVSVRDKNYTPGSKLEHPHGPIAQPVSTILESEAGRTAAEGEDEDTSLKRDAVNVFLKDLSISNPGLLQSLMESPEALENVLSLVQSGADVLNESSRPGEFSSPFPGTRSSVNGEINQVLQTMNGSVSVDQLSGQTSNGRQQPSVLATPVQQTPVQQTPAPGQTEDSVRMFPASQGGQQLGAASSERHGQPIMGRGTATHNAPSFNTPSIPVSQQETPRQTVLHNARLFQQPAQRPALFGQPVRVQVPAQNMIPTSTVQPYVHGSQQAVNSTSTQQAVNNSLFGQQRTNQVGHGNAYVQPLSGMPTLLPPQAIPQQRLVPQQTTFPGQSPLVQQTTQPAQPASQISDPRSRPQQIRSQQTVIPDVSAPPLRGRSPVEISEGLRYDPTSHRQDQIPTNQNTTDPVHEGRRHQALADTQKQPLTIRHKHAEGGLTTITMDPNNELPPNLQIGNNNYMVVNGGSEKEKLQKKRNKKRPKSQLTTNTVELSMDHIDMVSVEIGKDWKRLCRELGMTEADIEQLQFDYHVSGLYEIMYQGIQRWIQRNGKEANVKRMAEALWEVDRDDIALRLH